jgi:hypothetical protein
VGLNTLQSCGPHSL